MNIDISTANILDLDALNHLEHKVFDIERYHTISRQQYNYLLTKGKCLIFKAVLQENVVGAVVVFYRKNSKLGRLYSLAVDPDYQGQLIGHKLCLHVETALRKTGFEGLLCEMREGDKRLLSFYQKLGFKIIGRIDDYYADKTAGLKLKKLFIMDENI